VFHDYQLMPSFLNIDNLHHFDNHTVHRATVWVVVFISLCVMVIGVPILPPATSAAVIAAWAVFLWVTVLFINCHIDNLVIFWLALSPYLYYYLIFPRQTPVITPDRLLILILLIFMCLTWRSAPIQVLPKEAKMAAYFWGLYILVCIVSLFGQPITHELFGAYRLLLEGLVFPFLFGLYMMCFFDLRQNLYALHACICVLASGICIISVIEFVTGQNIFPWTGSGEYTAGAITQIIRPDGPYEQPAILSAIGLLLFILLAYLQTLMQHNLTLKRRLLHQIGIWSSLISALAPLNRGVIIILGILALIDMFQKRRIVPRYIWIFLFGGIVFLALFAKLAYPDVYADRTTDSDNIYQRLAQDKETLQVIRHHALLGVGMNYYNYFVSQDPKYLVRWRGIESMNVPHNLAMTVLAEEGLTGAFFFLAAQIFMIKGIWKTRKNRRRGWLAFLYCFLSYWLLGMDFALNYYADANLIYMLIIGLLYQSQYISNASDQINNFHLEAPHAVTA